MYTKSKPKVSGFYWLKEPQNNPYHPYVKQVVNVRIDFLGQINCNRVDFAGSQFDEDLDSFEDVEWSDSPVPKPWE